MGERGIYSQEGVKEAGILFSAGLGRGKFEKGNEMDLFWGFFCSLADGLSKVAKKMGRGGRGALLFSRKKGKRWCQGRRRGFVKVEMGL